MKVIGLIGGMSWESTAVYYRRLNEEARRRLGGLNSAEILLRSVDFTRIVEMQKRGAWSEAAAELAGIARALVAAGAEMILICTNTMHKVADTVEAAVDVPSIATGCAPPTGSRRWCPTPKAGPWHIGSSSTSCARDWCAGTRARRFASWSNRAARTAPIASFSAAPRSVC